ncbi:hypothetical protein ACFVZH_37330 [Streptomyces sp. NPDC059534]|uniref:hypothetical protein n=1 Tax=Streptomyces sp. NPDC059534 TaxID=3346859 RepID=UPI0036C8EED2
MTHGRKLMDSQRHIHRELAAGPGGEQARPPVAVVLDELPAVLRHIPQTRSLAEQILTAGRRPQDLTPRGAEA